MNRFARVLFLLVFAVFTSACGLLRAPAPASGPIEAAPLATAGAADETSADALSANETSADVSSTSETSADKPSTDAAAGQPSATAADPTPTAPPTTAAPPPAAGASVYTIVPGESQVRFELDEDLRSALTTWHPGSRITVVGATDQVTGEFALDFADLAATRFGEIRINARTLETDEFWRNRAIQNQILLTEAYEFITFTPTRLDGLPDAAIPGEPVTFNIEGDLTIRDVTLPQTFVVTATVTSDTQIVGTASALVARDAYDLVIPGVPNVANVEEMVELYIDFVARR